MDFKIKAMPWRTFALSVGCAFLFVSTSTAADESTGAPASAPIAQYQARLLDAAMDAATKIPINPHIKSRSKAQFKVFSAALELDQPRLATGYLMKIDDWRRGAGAADYAYYCVEHGQGETVDRYLRLAEASSKLTTQDWQRYTISLRIAQTRLLQGDDKDAKAFNKNVTDDVLRGRIEKTQAQLSDDEQFEKMSHRLDELIKLDRYDIIINGGDAYVALYEKHYANADRRKAIEDKLRRAYKSMPGPETMDLLMTLTGAALANKDAKQALKFIGEADEAYAAVKWPTTEEYEYVYGSTLARLRFEAGDSEGALCHLHKLRAKLEQHMDQIVSIWRSGALRAMAEAYARIGQHSIAVELYASALAQGVVNPNSVPRAQDLAATCASMAVHRVEPTQAIRAEIHNQLENLGPPW